MAGDWLKIETCLPEKPEVWHMAGILGMEPDLVVGKLFKVWRWFDQHTENGNAMNVTYALIDNVVGVTGFAEAMVFASWLEQKDTHLVLPNFERHNGKTAKNRALTAKRQAKFKGNAKVTMDALPREEKRREYKSSKSSSPRRVEGLSSSDQKPIEISARSGKTDINAVLVSTFADILPSKKLNKDLT
jgi:hypothetical protein